MEDILEIFIEAARWGRGEHFESVRLAPCAAYFRAYRRENGAHINAQRRANRASRLEDIRAATRERTPRVASEEGSMTSVSDLLGWYVRTETSKRWKWRFLHKPKYPFHSAVAKEYGNELPLGDHVVVVKEGKDGDERRFLVSNITTTYVRPLE